MAATNATKGRGLYTKRPKAHMRATKTSAAVAAVAIVVGVVAWACGWYRRAEAAARRQARAGQHCGGEKERCGGRLTTLLLLLLLIFLLFLLLLLPFIVAVAGFVAVTATGVILKAPSPCSI